MPDKYDRWTDEDLLDQIITKANQVSILSESNDLKDLRGEMLRRLRSAFPPPAEDMLDLVDRIQEIHVSCSEYDGMKMTRDEAAAEIESFAQSRVEPWREALEEFEAWWRLPNIARSVETIEPAMRKCLSLLTDSPAKEAAK